VTAPSAARYSSGSSSDKWASMAKKSDPTKDADFQSVVQHFLKTKPKPHKPKKKTKAK
jgi:hypothetical protein